MIEGAIPTLVLIGLAAVVAPIIAEWSRRFVAVPEVVIQILLGIVLGPYVLNLAHPNTIVTALSDFGLTYLMFLAGTELDLSTMRQGHLGRAAGSWGASLVLALGVGVFLHATGLVLDSVVVALCLTTTALGTLLPILHDAGVLRTPVGPSILSVGAIGEFGPIVAVAVLLTNRDVRVTFLLLALFVAVAVVAALLATQVHPPGFIALDAPSPPFDRATSGSDLGPARDPARLPGRQAQPRRAPRCVCRRCGRAPLHQGRGQRADHEQARGDRLRLPHPDLLH